MMEPLARQKAKRDGTYLRRAPYTHRPQAWLGSLNVDRLAAALVMDGHKPTEVAQALGLKDDA